MSKEIAISICTFNDGTFDVMIQDPETSREITLSGAQEINQEDHSFILEIAPACVWTKYSRITPED